MKRIDSRSDKIIWNYNNNFKCSKFKLMNDYTVVYDNNKEVIIKDLRKS
jgi:hypothetical protein